MSQYTYLDFIDDLLVEIARRHHENDEVSVYLEDAAKAIGHPRPPGDVWLKKAARDFENAGYGLVHVDVARIHMLAPGLQAAARICEHRRPKGITDFVKSFSRSDWIALTAIVISFLSLLRN